MSQEANIQIKTQDVKIFFGIIVLVVLGFIGFFALSSKGSSSTSNQPISSIVSTEGDKQIISMTAKTGFTPNQIVAKSGTDTILRVKTSNTFDCSASISIPKLGVSKSLPFTGTTDIALGNQPPGTKLSGTCSMGMYSFSIDFISNS